jgi:Flp pilus assembly pilin Flp
MQLLYATVAREEETLMLTILTKCSTLVAQIRGSSRDERGVTTVEYAVMLALVALAVALATPNIRDGVVGIFDATSTQLNLM